MLRSLSLGLSNAEIAAAVKSYVPGVLSNLGLRDRQEPGDDSGLDDEAQPVDREFGAVAFAEIFHFDHGVCLSGIGGVRASL